MFQRLPRISSALYRLLVTSSCCHSFTCPLVKNNKANWNSDSRVTHKQADTRCRGGTLFTQILKPFWVSTCPRNSCPPTATGADAEPRAAGSESPSENPSRPTPKQLGGWKPVLSKAEPSSRGSHSGVNCCGRSRFGASTAAWATSRADDRERTHHPHAYTVKKLQEEDVSPSVLTHKAALTKS